MQFYYFGGSFEHNLISRLEESGFAGTMFVYDPVLGDVFTRMARDIKYTEKIKYLVAIRPYSISPQYLCMINKSIKTIMPDRLQINLISGHIKEHEKRFGGIIGDINDLSSRVERSNYLIDYLDVINNLENADERVKYPDFYVTTTNRFVFDKANEYNNKMIISYRDYKNGHWMTYDENHQMRNGEKFDLSNKNVMIALTPVIREMQKDLDLVDRSKEATDTEYFTYETFDALVKKLESENINHLLINGWPYKERDVIIDFIKKYTQN